MKRFLPIGSVVMLNDSIKRLMIIGVKQVQEDGTEWDYSGCLFPEGLINSNEIFVFNEDQIDTLFFIGLQDNESLEYMQALSELSDAEDVAAPTQQPVAPRPAIQQHAAQQHVAQQPVVQQPVAQQPVAQQAPPPPPPRPTANTAVPPPGGGFCGSCAYPVPSNAKFCKNCGAAQ